MVLLLVEFYLGESRKFRTALGAQLVETVHGRENLCTYFLAELSAEPVLVVVVKR